MTSRDRKYRHPDGVGLKRMARSTEDMTPQQAINWLSTVTGVDGYDAVVSRGIFVDWYSPMTAEELEKRAEHDANTQARIDKYERETYARLREKFGDDHV